MLKDGPVPALFVVGCGRSGTTLVYHMLCQHRSSAWISTWADRLQQPVLARANDRWRGKRPDSRLPTPLPSEAYRTWDRVFPGHAGLASRPLSSGDVDDEARRRLTSVMASYRRFGSGQVFLNKNTRNTRRLALLSSACPEALFLHVLRHPLDAISSQLNVAWWPDLPLWTRDGRSPRDVARDDVDDARLSAELWVSETQQALNDSASIPAGGYLEVHYEDVVADPIGTLAPVVVQAGLAVTADYENTLRSWPMRSSVGSHKDRLSPRQLDSAREIAGPLAETLGYDLWATG